MTQDEIIEFTKRSGLGMLLEIGGMDKCLEHFAKLVDAKATAREREACEKQYMQLFLDPENQPTQFGTATQEYREQEIKEIQNLLTELSHYVRTKHLYGPEVKKMLEQEEAIRARGEA